MSTVAETWDMRCPSCSDDSRIDVAATVRVRLTPDGTDIFEAGNGDHEWDGNSFALCCGCGHSGPVRGFEQGAPRGRPWPTS